MASWSRERVLSDQNDWQLLIEMDLPRLLRRGKTLKQNRFSSFPSSTVLAGFLAICAIPASAALVGTTTNPTGVTDLAVDGNFYNVSFSTDFYLNVFPSGPQFNDWIPATDAATALSAALNSFGVTALGGHDCDTLANVDHQGGCGILIPFPPTGGWQINTATSSWFYWLGDPSATPPVPPFSDTQFGTAWTYISVTNPALGMNALGESNVYDEWAVFTFAGAPEPASMLMLGTGMILISLAARRLRKK
jgi:hypothetical protein